MNVPLDKGGKSESEDKPDEGRSERNPGGIEVGERAADRGPENLAIEGPGTATKEATDKAA